MSAPLVLGQSVPRKPLFTEPLERESDAPMFIWGNGRSDAMISQHGPFTSYQVNVDGNGQNMTGDAANEPSTSVDPTNPNKMAIGWRQFNSVASNFRQAGWGFTTNRGVSWTFPACWKTVVPERSCPRIERHRPLLLPQPSHQHLR